MSDEAARPEEMSFGEALAELEQIVRALESGQLELEEGLARYERGVALLRSCQDKLAQARQRVTSLIGELEAEECEADEADQGEAG
jgi:exodeoxyribonuclease VII small subunit